MYTGHSEICLNWSFYGSLQNTASCIQLYIHHGVFYINQSMHGCIQTRILMEFIKPDEQISKNNVFFK